MNRWSARVTVASLLSLFSCIGPQVAVRVPESGDVTIFLHGYKGSFLREVDGDQQLAWMTPGLAMSKGEKSLAYSFEGQRDFARYGALKVDGPMTKLTVLPLLIEEPGYQGFMQWGVDTLPGFVAFAYDWRQDVRTSANELCAFIERLGPGRKVKLIGHSMGGLVSLQCLRRGSAAVRNVVTHVVFLGTPFRGAPAIFDDLFIGSVNGRNSTLVNREALLTFTSAFQLIGPSVPGATEATADLWQTNRWGIFADETLTETSAYNKKLAEQLSANAALVQSLADEDGPAPTYKALAVIGTGEKTIASWPVQGTAFDLKNPNYGDGDGLVTVESAVPPRPLAAQVVRLPAEHSAMVFDRALQKAVADFLSAP